jgi:hypothetical protein
MAKRLIKKEMWRCSGDWWVFNGAKGQYSLEPIKAFPGMYCIRWPDGSLSDMVNITRAKAAVREVEDRH